MHTTTPVLTRTTVELDRALVREAMRAANASTMREAIELGLRALVDAQRRLKAIERHFGKHPGFAPPEDDPRE